MPTSWILALGIALLSVYDVSVSHRRILKYGPDIELNPVIRWIIPRLGLDTALGVGIMLPSLLVTTVLATLDFQTVLAIWFGAKAVTARYQMLSLRIEAEIDRLRGVSTASSSTPPDDPRPGDSQ